MISREVAPYRRTAKKHGKFGRNSARKNFLKKLVKLGKNA